MSFEVISSLDLNYKSKSGSQYYFTNEGVYRLSNHWSRVANCRWRIESNSKEKLKLGFAKWSDFYPDNDFEKLYFIVVKNNEVNYFHKKSDKYYNQILRTASETTKLIRQIRNLIEDTAWTKYLKQENIEQIRFEIISELITTNQSFQEIRKKYL